MTAKEITSKLNSRLKDFKGAVAYRNMESITRQVSGCPEKKTAAPRRKPPSGLDCLRNQTD